MRFWIEYRDDPTLCSMEEKRTDKVIEFIQELNKVEFMINLNKNLLLVNNKRQVVGVKWNFEKLEIIECPLTIPEFEVCTLYADPYYADMEVEGCNKWATYFDREKKVICYGSTNKNCGDTCILIGENIGITFHDVKLSAVWISFESFYQNVLK